MINSTLTCDDGDDDDDNDNDVGFISIHFVFFLANLHEQWFKNTHLSYNIMSKHNSIIIVVAVVVQNIQAN